MVNSRTCTLCIARKTVDAQGETMDTAKTMGKRFTGRYAQTTCPSPGVIGAKGELSYAPRLFFYINS
jgi:hypothetical protein